MQKVEFVKNKFGYLGEEICKLSVEGEIWFYFVFQSKIWEGRDKLREEFFSKEELGCMIQEIGSLFRQ